MMDTPVFPTFSNFSVVSRLLMSIALIFSLSSPSAMASRYALEQLNKKWVEVFNKKDTDQIRSFFTEDILDTSYPYNPSAVSQGINAVESMFINGPFNIQELQLKTEDLVIGSTSQSGLVLKRFKMGQLWGDVTSGIAIKVASEEGGEWRWNIELSAPGIHYLHEFAELDYEPDNSAFGGVVSPNHPSYSGVSGFFGKEVIVLDADAEIPKPGEYNPYKYTTTVNNLLAIENGDKGLLISQVTYRKRKFITFSSVRKAPNYSWYVMVQIWKAFPTQPL